LHPPLRQKPRKAVYSSARTPHIANRIPRKEFFYSRAKSLTEHTVSQTKLLRFLKIPKPWENWNCNMCTSIFFGKRSKKKKTVRQPNAEKNDDISEVTFASHIGMLAQMQKSCY